MTFPLICCTTLHVGGSLVRIRELNRHYFHGVSCLWAREDWTCKRSLMAGGSLFKVVQGPK